MQEGTSFPRDSRKLVAASFLMLFTELALIRWTAAWVVYLAYFTNFVLLASFLGIGIGFLRGGNSRDASRWAPLAIGLVMLFVLIFPVQVARTSGGRVFTGLFGFPALPLWFMLPLIFLGVVFAMTLVGEVTARLFVQFAPLQAYRYDVIGSIAGITAFSALSWLHARPVIWGLVMCLTALFLLGEPRRLWDVVGLVVLLATLAAGSLASQGAWSPYYRVIATSHNNGTVGIRVNGIPHQSILPFRYLRTTQPFYLYPYSHIPDRLLRDVLVIGAGTGNDVEVALHEGAQHIDAVEIDPVIQAIGQDRNPDRPYQNPRVSAFVDDGRAFVERSDRRYDLIVLALPDSLTLVAGQGSLRLESYLFTAEAISADRLHLKPDGVLTMYNYYRPFVFDRFANTLTSVFGHPPCLDRSEERLGARQQAVLTVSIRPGVLRCDTPWTPTRAAAVPATDDHPFPYLQGRRIPTFYLISLLAMLLGSLLLVRRASGPFRRMSGYVDLFCMGAAFLLLETKNVVQFALLFGTTWFVNSLVFAGILLAVYLAVELASHVDLPRPRYLYGVLLLALGVAWVVRPEGLLRLAVIPRFAVAAALAFAPVFVANLVFAQRFKRVPSSTLAFGANLLGAMVGGLVEYFALVVGYRDLLIVIAVLYAIAFLTGRRDLEETREDVREVVSADTA